MTGLEPVRVLLRGLSIVFGSILLQKLLLPTELHGSRLIYILHYTFDQATQGSHSSLLLSHYPSPQHWLTHYWCLLSGRRLIVLFNTPLLPWLIRPTFNISSLPSALHYYLPALLSTCRGHLVAVAGFGTYLYSLSAVLTGFDSVSFHSIGFEVYFDAVSCKSLQMLSFWRYYAP